MSDPEARKLTGAQRGAVAEYLQLVSGGEHKTKKVILRGALHPSVERAKNIIEKSFVQLCLKDQDILGTEEGWSKVLALVTEEDLKADFTKICETGKSSEDRWEKMKNRTDHYKGTANTIKKKRSTISLRRS